MATHLRERLTIQDAADVCSAIAGALHAEPTTTHLTPLWDALVERGDQLAGARRAAERKLARARAKLAVKDAAWDPEVAAFGRDVVDQSAGKRDQSPYTRFFKHVSPSGAQKFGIGREIEQGQAWIAELARDPHENLAKTWTPRLSLVTENLASAEEERRNAMQAVALQNVAEDLFIADVNREIDILEGELLKLFPRQPKRVAAFLDATRPQTNRSRNDDPSPDQEG